MTSEEYGQYIDDFELGADVMPGESLTDYIERRRREFESKADGGSIGIEVLFTDKKPRKNFFMGGPALEGQALDIYNSMSAYGFTDQQIADALSARGLSSSGIKQPEQVTGIINKAIPESGNDGPKGDFGLFGDLLKDTAKDFNVQVYDEELGDFIDTTLTGYKNVNTGLFQTKEGKNINPMFSNTGVTPGFLGMFSNMLGLNKTVGGFKPGSIRGKYDGIRDIFNKQQKQQKDIIQKQQEEKARQEALKKELERLAAQNRIYGSGGGRDESLNLGPGGSYTGRGDVGATTANQRGEFATDSLSYDLKDGGPVGLATMFTRRR